MTAVWILGALAAVIVVVTAWGVVAFLVECFAPERRQLPPGW